MPAVPKLRNRITTMRVGWAVLRERFRWDKGAEINEPLPSAVAILRRDCYNWTARGRRLGHGGRVRGAPKGGCVVVCIRDRDRYRRRGQELRVRVNFLGNDLNVIIAGWLISTRGLTCTILPLISTESALFIDERWRIVDPRAIDRYIYGNTYIRYMFL